jgi:hypothetical protein
MLTTIVSTPESQAIAITRRAASVCMPSRTAARGDVQTERRTSRTGTTRNTRGRKAGRVGVRGAAPALLMVVGGF